MPAYEAFEKGFSEEEGIEAALDVANTAWQPDSPVRDQPFVRPRRVREVAMVVALPRPRLPRRGPGPLAALT